MKKQATIQITKAENGYTIRIQTDVPGENKLLVASTEADVVKQITEAVKVVVTKPT